MPAPSMQLDKVLVMKSKIALRLAAWYGHKMVGLAGSRLTFGAFMSSSMAVKRHPVTAMT